MFFWFIFTVNAFDEVTLGARISSLESALGRLLVSKYSSWTDLLIKLEPDLSPASPQDENPVWKFSEVPEGLASWLAYRGRDLLIPNYLQYLDHLRTSFTFDRLSDAGLLSDIAGDGWKELHESSVPIEWPFRFGDRLSVIQFDFFRNASTGVAGSFGNSATTVCEILQPIELCNDGGHQFCEGVVRHAGNPGTCMESCGRKGLRCTGAYDDTVFGSCPSGENIPLTCEALRYSLVCRCTPV